MRIVRTTRELREARRGLIGLVPTMGAFHQGHLDLMRRAREESDQVVVSLFFNPTQFGKNEDFDKYPRDIDRDAEMARSVGVDVLFAPPVEEVYPNMPTTTVSVPEVTDRWEGASRPGHFEGVATVVSKLFNMVTPDVAYFGQKDLQQCRVIQRMTCDLNFPLKIQICPTTREPDGLAMSSRNVYLSAEERSAAPVLFRELKRCSEILPQSGTNVSAELGRSRDALATAGFSVDYFEWVRLDDLAPVDQRTEGTAMITAAKLGRTRLIDNVLL